MEDKIIRPSGATTDPPMPGLNGGLPNTDGMVQGEIPLDIAPWSSPYRFDDEPPAILASKPLTMVPMPLVARSAATTLFRPAGHGSAAPQGTGLVSALDRILTGRRKTLAAVLGALALLLIALGGWTVLGQRGLDGASTTAAYTAPTLVLRAAIGGRVMAIDVAVGDAVEPDTRLLVLRVGSTSALPIKGPSDLIIRARVRGVVRGLDAPAGLDVVAGTPIARLADCDRAFLAMQAGDSAAKAGMQVHVTLPGRDPFNATLRDAAGNGEPPGTLVADPDTATSLACPLGATASISLLPDHR